MKQTIFAAAKHRATGMAIAHVVARILRSAGIHQWLVWRETDLSFRPEADRSRLPPIRL